MLFSEHWRHWSALTPTAQNQHGGQKPLKGRLGGLIKLAMSSYHSTSDGFHHGEWTRAGKVQVQNAQAYLSRRVTSSSS